MHQSSQPGGVLIKFAASGVVGLLATLCLAPAAHAQLCVDGDVDGVCDDRDECLYTAAFAFVDARGCALDGDADGDRIPDQDDRCPYSPANAEVDAEGCALDADADGIPDGLDQCPATAMGAWVDAVGCLAAGSDTSEPAAAPVDANRPPALPLRISGYVRNSSNIPAAALEDLRALAPSLVEELDAEPGSSLRVVGYADPKLESALLLQLAENRAALIRAALGAAGVPMPRIYAIAGGASTDGAFTQIMWSRAGDTRP